MEYQPKSGLSRRPIVTGPGSHSQTTDTYTPGGRLETRTGEHGIVTEYDHENAVAHHYSQTHGRLETISGGGLQPPAKFDYTYEPDSPNLIGTLTGPAHSVTHTWSPTRNILLAKENKTLALPPSLISGYTDTVSRSDWRERRQTKAQPSPVGRWRREAVPASTFQIGQRETFVIDGSAYSHTNRGWT